jgi:hypothetical protein
MTMKAHCDNCDALVEDAPPQRQVTVQPWGYQCVVTITIEKSNSLTQTLCAGLLIELPLDALDRLSAQAETSGPALYPDIWRANAKAIMEDRELLRALVTAKRDVLTTSPSLQQLAPIIAGQADGHRPLLNAAFRELFTRRELAAIPPAVVLTALVRFIADRAPDIEKRNV